MINTINTKQEQLKNGYFSIGTGKEVILIIGSCRSVPYMNYFSAFNDENDNRFTVCFIDPFNWNFDLHDNRTNFEEVIDDLKNNDALISPLKNKSEK